MKYGLILSILIAVPCMGQTTATGEAMTSGPCSPAVTGSSNQFTINCQGVGKEQGAQFLEILNKIVNNQLDPKLVMAKLDEIQKGVSNITGELATQREREEEAERIRRTPPRIDAYLVPVGKGKVNLQIKSNNLIPFEYRYDIVTEDNLIVAPFPVSMAKIYPDKNHMLFFLTTDLQLERIKNHYLELRFTFQSLSNEELHLPGHEGAIVRKYRIGDDETSLTQIP